jgi:hypothetical protein
MERYARSGQYARLIRGKWTHGIPIDLFIRQLVQEGALRASVTVPFLTRSRTASSPTCAGKPIARARSATWFRRGFFEEADHSALLTQMRALTKGARLSDLVALFVKAESFSSSDRWTPF